MVRGKVDNCATTMLVDSGSQITIVRKDVLPGWPRKIEPTTIQPAAVNGTPLTFLGRTLVDLAVMDVSLGSTWVYVISPDHMTNEMILGTDVLEKLGSITINFQEKTVGLDTVCVPTVVSPTRSPPFGGFQPRCCRVSLHRCEVIPPMHEKLCRAVVDVPPHQQGLIEGDNDLIEKKGVACAHSLNRVGEDRTTWVRLCNPSDEPIKIYEGTTLGSFEPDIKNSVFVGQVDATSSQATNSESNPALEKLVDEAKVNQAEKQQLQSLLHEFADVFSWQGELGRTSQIKHEIHTGSATPLRSRPRQTGHHEKAKVDKLLQDMLANDIIEESTSPWASPIVLATKKDGSTRFCVDYRRLNSVTEDTAYPLPRIDETLDCLGNSQWFSTLDLASGYWQVELAEEAKQKSAFVTHRGLHQFKVMPFGLKGAPATFQRLMASIFADYLWLILLIYLDDILVFSSSVNQHLERLRLVFLKLREAHLKLKPSKCFLLQREVEYLGHILSREGIAPTSRLVDAVENFPQPQSVQEVKRFLGLASYYRRFIQGFSSIAEPLNQVTHKGRTFAWSPACQKAFQELKAAMVTAPVLAHPAFEVPFHLTTDASGVGVGAVLEQTVNGITRPVAYASSTLNKAQRNYSATDRECYAVKWAINKFRCYLYGTKFTVHTDHQALSYLRSLKEPRGMLACWQADLQAFDFSIAYHPGLTIPHADALSRAPLVAATAIKERWSHEDLCALQEADPTISKVKRLVRLGQQCPGNANAAVRTLMTRAKGLYVDQNTGLLCCRYRVGKRDCVQVVFPDSHAAEVLHLVHDCHGHLGVKRTLMRLRQSLFWPEMAVRVTE